MSQRVWICRCGWRGRSVGGARSRHGQAPSACPTCGGHRFRVRSEKHPQITRQCQECQQPFLGGTAAIACPRCRPNLLRRHLLVMAGKKKKYRWTPELDAVLKRSYDGRVKRRAAEILTRLGWPTWVIKKQAAVLGLTYSFDRRDFTAKEVSFIEEWTGSRPSAWIAKHLHRSIASVVLKQKRMKICRRVRLGYTVHELSLCFGVDHHGIDRWIHEGKLNAARLGTARPHDTWRVEDEDILRFIEAHPMAFRLDKVDQVWFLDLLTAGGVMRRALAAARGNKSAA